MVKGIAIYVLGLSSSVLLHIYHILSGTFNSSQRGDVMSGILASFPENLIALVLFIIAVVVIWKYEKRGRKEKQSEQKSKKENEEAENSRHKEIIDAIKSIDRKNNNCENGNNTED